MLPVGLHALGEGLHAQVIAELPGYPVCFTFVKVTEASPAYLTLVKISGRGTSGARSDPRYRAMASHTAAPYETDHGDEDEYLHESYAVNRNRHLEELHRLSSFQQVTTKVPPSCDGRSSWFASEDAIDDWRDITELEGAKEGPALRNRLEGEAAIHKRLLRGAANVFLYRFQQFMNLHRGSGDMLRWITRFQLSLNRMQEAWNDTYIPIMDVNNAEVRAYVMSLPQEEQQTITPEEVNLVALVFVSLSDLTQDQRQVLTSLMAHRNRVLADYGLGELREVYLEIFCTTKTSVDNPLLAPSGHGGRKTFLVLDEGYLDNSEGYWVEDEDDGTEGFLEADEDAFWVYDDASYSWFQRRFQGSPRKTNEERSKGPKKRQEQGSTGRRFFKKKKGPDKSHFADDQSQSDAWQSDWQWQEASWDEYAAKGKGKKGKKGKCKGKGGKDGRKMISNDGTANLADEPAQNSSATIAHSFTASSVGEAYLAQPLTPASMAMDLGCTRAMVSRASAQNLTL